MDINLFAFLIILILLLMVGLNMMFESTDSNDRQSEPFHRSSIHNISQYIEKYSHFVKSKMLLENNHSMVYDKSNEILPIAPMGITEKKKIAYVFAG